MEFLYIKEGVVFMFITIYVHSHHIKAEITYAVEEDAEPCVQWRETLEYACAFERDAGICVCI